jgi:hypothetical protein
MINHINNHVNFCFGAVVVYTNCYDAKARTLAQDTASHRGDGEGIRGGAKDKQEKPGCRLCNDTESIREFEYWRLMPNKFPYDRFCSKSDMLVTKRHTDETGLTKQEREEYFKLKSEVLVDEYDSVLDHLPKQKSIPNHCHFHLISFKRPE